MAYGKHYKSDGIACGTFKDAICPTPTPKGTWGGMGSPLTDGPPETKGELPGVQYATNVPGAPAPGTSISKPGSSE